MKHSHPTRRLFQILFSVTTVAASSIVVAQSSMKTTNNENREPECIIVGPKSTTPSAKTRNPKGSDSSLRIGYTTKWSVLPASAFPQGGRDGIGYTTKRSVLPGQPGRVSYCVTPTVEALGATWTSPVTLMLLDKRAQESPDEKPDNPAVFKGLTMQNHIGSPPKTAVVGVPIAAGTKVNVATSPAWCESNIFWYMRPDLVIETDSGVSCRVRFGARDNRSIGQPTTASPKPPMK